ncbi:MAG: oligosaccharide flippase family protein [Eubacteriales bacterium]|nr:oligosaccharide flippase family protein [Eubacteriales bacterium]
MAKNHGYSRHDTCGGGSNFRNRHNADRRCDSRVDHDTGNRFAAGVAVLTLSSLITKILGLVFKIPMNRLMGDAAMGYYNAAYSIFTFFYMLSTAGIPVALSILVARAKAEEGAAQKKRVFCTALGLLSAIGTIGTAILLRFAGSLAETIGAPPAAWCIAVIAPTLFFICIASALRGYFQGLSYMLPTAVSQLVEAIGKVGIGIACGVYAISQGFSPAITAAYAVSGLTIGTALGMLYLVITGCIYKEAPTPDRAPPQSYRRILAAFAAIAVPVTISSSVMSLTNMIDTALIQRLLQSAGMTQEAATAAYGNYTSLAVPLFNLPPVLVYPIAYAIVPRITGYKAAGAYDKLRESVLAALKIAVWIGLPCAMGLSALSEPILTLLYRADSAQLAAPLLTALAPSSFLVCLLAVTNSVLQAVGKAYLPVIAMAAGAGVKIAASLTLIPRLGIIASPLGTFFCYAVVTVISLCATGNEIRKNGVHVPLFTIFCKPFVAAAVAVGGAYGVYRLLSAHLPNALVLCSAIGLAVILYLPLLWYSGAVGETELACLPLPRTLTGRLRRMPQSITSIAKEEKNGLDFREDPHACGQKKLYFGRSAHPDRDPAQPGRMPMGPGTNAPIHPQRSH